MCNNQEAQTLKYLKDLELQNQSLKKQLTERDQEINRLVKDECEYVVGEECECSCLGETDYDEGWEFCPWCGGKIVWTTQAEKDQEAYEMYIESEIDWKREQAVFGE